MELQAGRLKLLLKDNGEWFDPTLNTHGFGLAGMRERVEGLSGSFKLNANSGAGVEIHVSLPIMLRAGI